MTASTPCPNCNSSDVFTQTIVIDRKTGLPAPSRGWMVLGVGMILAGLLLCFLAFITRGDRTPGVPGFWQTALMGIFVMSFGLQFVGMGGADRVGLLRHGCRQCGAGWKILADEHDGVGARPLMESLVSENPDVREGAAAALGNIGYPGFGEALTNALQDPAPKVRAAAGAALAKLGNPAGLPLLLELLSDADLDVRAKAAEGLGTLGEPEVVEPIIQALIDAKWTREDDFATALGSIRNPAARGALTTAAQHDNITVVMAANRAIEGMEKGETAPP